MITRRCSAGFALAVAMATLQAAGSVPVGAATTTPPTIAYTLPTTANGAHAVGLTHGSDGRLWFTDINNATVGSLDPSTAAVREWPVSNGQQFLRYMADGPDGAVWFTQEGSCLDTRCSDFTDGKIGRITSDGQLTEYKVPTANGHPWGITHGPDGNLWFTEIGDNLHSTQHKHLIEGNKIGRITPQGVITEFPVPTVDSFPDGITTGPDGALWFTENRGQKIGRITTAGVITEYAIATAGYAIGIAAGLDGNLWFTEQFGQRIGRITPQGQVTEYPLPNAGNPVWITLGPDGAMWFTEVRGQRIGRIAADGTITEIQLADGTYPLSITIGPGFADVWYSETWSHKIDRMLVCDDPEFLAACGQASAALRNPTYQPKP